MRLVCLLATCTTLVAGVAHADDTRDDVAARSPNGDLFPAAGHATAAAATGLPFFGIAEVGYAFTRGVALGAIGGITPSVVTAGLRPRFRVATSARTALVLSIPMLYYPRASAPGPGNIGETTWVLARPELFFDAAVGERAHLAGGMGLVAAAATVALEQAAEGRDFAMPPYGGTSKRGFAGGAWNTLAARGSWRTGDASHLFFETSLVMNGFVPANNVGGPPIVVTLGAQSAF